MILSHKHKFIFVHVAKTAGTTVKVYMAPHLGPVDLQLGAYRETRASGTSPNLRTYLDLVRRPSFKSLRALAERRLTSAINTTHGRLYKRTLGPVFDHCGAPEISAFAPAEWGSYYKFCVVRNPFDRMVSFYKWKTRKSHDPQSFSEMLHNIAEKRASGIRTNDARSWELYTLDDKIVVDCVVRQEDFLSGMASVCSAVGLPFDPAGFPRSKESSIKRSYRDYYSPKDVRVVESLFDREIETFKYSF